MDLDAASYRELVSVITGLSERYNSPEAENIAKGLIEAGWIAGPESVCAACGASTRERLAY